MRIFTLMFFCMLIFAFIRTAFTYATKLQGSGTCSAMWTQRYIYTSAGVVSKETLSDQALKLTGNIKNNMLFIKKAADCSHKPFSQLIFSWNALRPSGGGFFRFFVRARNKATKQWLPWHKAAEWGAGVQRSFMSKHPEGSDYLFVRLELPDANMADDFELRIEPYKGASLAHIKLIAVTTSRFSQLVPDNTQAPAIQKLCSVHIKGVPPISQLAFNDRDSTRICSPTSTSMVISYLTRKPINALEFAHGVFDTGLGVYGSWPFNCAHAFEKLKNNYYVYATRLKNFKELHEVLMRNIPVVVSICGPLPEAPRPMAEGHLLVVLGYDAKNQRVLCNDPGYPTDQEVVTSYRLSDFLVAWERRSRFAYVFEACKARTTCSENTKGGVQWKQ